MEVLRPAKPCYITPSRGLARLLRRGPGMWRLEPERERFMVWMRTSNACPPFQVECRSQTPKLLPLSRAPYTTTWLLLLAKSCLLASRETSVRMFMRRSRYKITCGHCQTLWFLQLLVPSCAPVLTFRLR